MTNLTGQPCHLKTGESLRKKRSVITKDIFERRQRIIALGCILPYLGFTGCKGRTTLQHCDTGMGRRKDEDKTCPLCVWHHLSWEEGIDGKRIGRREWEKRYVLQRVMVAKARELLGEDE